MVAEVWPDEQVVVTLHPDVDPHGLPHLREQLHQILAGGVRTIVVDASCLDELPLGVMGTLLTAHRTCEARGGHISIRYASRRALDQLGRSGLARLFHIERPPALVPSSVLRNVPAHRRADIV